MTVVSSSGLISLFVVNLSHSLFPGVGAIDCLGIVIRNVGGLAGSGDGVVLLVDQFDQETSLLVGDLNVLAYHNKTFEGWRLGLLFSI